MYDYKMVVYRYQEEGSVDMFYLSGKNIAEYEKHICVHASKSTSDYKKTTVCSLPKVENG